MHTATVRVVRLYKRTNRGIIHISMKTLVLFSDSKLDPVRILRLDGNIRRGAGAARWERRAWVSALAKRCAVFDFRKVGQKNLLPLGRKNIVIQVKIEPPNQIEGECHARFQGSGRPDPYQSPALSRTSGPHLGRDAQQFSARPLSATRCRLVGSAPDGLQSPTDFILVRTKSR